jgi:hypothetical protein
MAMKDHELLNAIFEQADDMLAAQCGRWMDESKPFRQFVAAYQTKIRKKARSQRDDEGRADLLCELAIANHLLQERRFTIEYEKQGVGKQRGPDFTVTYKTHTQFHVEVKRLRTATPAEQAEPQKLPNAICAKLGQMLPGALNILALGADDERYDEDAIARAVRLLKQHAEQKDDGFFVRRGFAHARDFLHGYLRLGAVVVSHGLGARAAPAALWINKEARHPLPNDLATMIRRLL